MLLLELHTGNTCQIQRADEILGHAIAWPASEKILDSVVQTSKALQTLYSLKLGDKVSILRNKVPVEDAKSVHLSELYPEVAGISPPYTPLNALERPHWSWLLEHILEKAEHLGPGMVFENVELRGEKRSFRISSINAKHDLVLFRARPNSKIIIKDNVPTESGKYASAHEKLKISDHDIGGLTRQIQKLNKHLAAYGEEQRRIKYPVYYRRHRGGIILHGPPGTGKSMLLRKICAAPWHKVFHIDSALNGHGIVSSEVLTQNVFDDALRYQPSVIIVDNLQSVAGKRDLVEDRKFSIANKLCEGLDRLGDAHVLVIAATTSLAGVDETLRRPGRFEFEIEIPVPDSSARTEILKVVTGLPKTAENEGLENLGNRTHGFVGADLDMLTQLAVDNAIERTLPLHSNEDGSKADDGPVIEIEVAEADFNDALLDVRPIAMREVFLETPQVQWSDIGGQKFVKKILRQAVEWPFKFPSELQRLGIEPRKGLVLYGPPGCSKTLIAKAIATEAGLNFIAVKGAELLSMYVGESERGVREVFRKARAASPSIIFFDEIDALGTSRGGAGYHGSLNVVTTLLNELDGIELLKRVFVLAATNKPEVLDPALLRPGRLDSVLYVGLPDVEARKEILQLRILRMDIDDTVNTVALGEATEGYSGAEVVSICHKAGYAALEDQIDSGVEQQVGQKHFELAMAEVHRGITPAMIQSYKEWGAKRP